MWRTLLAYDLGSIISDVQTKIKDSTYPTGNITVFVNNAQREIFNRNFFPFMETESTYTLSQGNDSLSGGTDTSDVQAPITARITDTDEEVVLQFRDHTWIHERFPNPANEPENKPEYWYGFGKDYKVHPIPDQSYTLKLKYFKAPTELSNNSDVPEVPEAFGELLVLGGAHRALETRDYYDEASLLRNQFYELLEDMVIRYSIRQYGRAHRMPINRRSYGKINLF